MRRAIETTVAPSRHAKNVWDPRLFRSKAGPLGKCLPRNTRSGYAAGQGIAPAVWRLLRLLDGFDRQHFRELCPGPVDSALDCSHRAIADLRRFLVGKARSADQDEGLPLIRGELEECLAKLAELDMSGLCLRSGKAFGISTVDVLDLA